MFAWRDGIPLIRKRLGDDDESRRSWTSSAVKHGQSPGAHQGLGSHPMLEAKNAHAAVVTLVDKRDPGAIRRSYSLNARQAHVSKYSKKRSYGCGSEMSSDHGKRATDGRKTLELGITLRLAVIIQTWRHLTARIGWIACPKPYRRTLCIPAAWEDYLLDMVRIWRSV